MWWFVPGTNSDPSADDTNVEDGSEAAPTPGRRPASLVPDAAGLAGGERKARLELADRLTTLGALSAAIGHEVNNPLTYVLGNMRHVLGCLERK